MSFDYYSYKQLRQIVDGATQELVKQMPELEGQLGLVKFPIREKIAGLIERQTDMQTQAVFESLYNKKKLCFFLECREARFEIPPKLTFAPPAGWRATIMSPCSALCSIAWPMN